MEEAGARAPLPAEFVADAWNMVVDYLADGVDALEGEARASLFGLVARPTDEDRILSLRLTEACDGLLSHLEDRLASQFDLFEKYVSDALFQLPPLSGGVDGDSEDDDEKEEAPDAEESSLDAQLLTLKAQIRQRVAEHRFYESKSAYLTDMNEKLEAVLTPLEALRDSMKTGGCADLPAVEDLAQRMEYLVSLMAPPSRKRKSV